MDACSQVHVQCIKADGRTFSRELDRFVCRFCRHAGLLGCGKCRYIQGGCGECRAGPRPPSDGRNNIYPPIPASMRCGHCHTCRNSALKKVWRGGEGGRAPDMKSARAST